MFGAEFPAIQFFERNGFSIGYYSGRDTDASSPEKLAALAKVFVSVGHDEYWTGRQRANVEEARDRLGLHFVSLAGNQVFWRTRFEGDTMIVYKETASNVKIDPKLDEWTGTFRDGRDINPLGAQPENALSGLIYTVNAWRLDPLLVPYRYSSLRWWNNTELRQMAKSGHTSVLSRGLLGHEWDEDLDNGFRPASMIRLSETHVDNVMYAIDAGSVYDSGSGSHHLVLWKHPKSGAVTFGAGTVQFSWGLAPIHDDVGGVNLLNNFLNSRLAYDVTSVEQSIQQLLVNVLAHQGVRGSALQEGLTQPGHSTDTQSPQSRCWCEGDDDDSTLVRIQSSDLGGGIVASVELSFDGGITWKLAQWQGNGSLLMGQASEWTYNRDAHTMSRGVLCRATDDSLNTGKVVECEQQKNEL